MRRKSIYASVLSDHSFCPDCGEYVTLIYHIEDQLNNPQFYICWSCDKVFQVGIGEVKKEGE